MISNSDVMIINLTHKNLKHKTQLTLVQELGLWQWNHPSSIFNTKGFMAMFFEEKPFILLLFAF
jgi:hypothetical protein